MKEILVRTASRESRIFIGEKSLERIPALAKGRKLFVATDSNVYALYPSFFEEYFFGAPVFVLPAGEENKTVSSLEGLLEKMLESGLDRKSLLFVVGGGTVGDLGGFAAAIFARGISYVQIPTTLLAQVDSSVGGKTAVNLSGVKNAVGAFHQPTEVLIAPSFLKTLSFRELKCGVGEIVKYAALDRGIYRSLLENERRVCAFELEYLEGLIESCVKIKADVVERDEKETGDRKSLNVGHTTGHAIELAFGLSHGESVLYGFLIETEIAMEMGVCERAYGENLSKIIRSALKAEPKTVPELKNVEIYAEKVKSDKKNEEGNVVLSVAKSEGEWALLSFPYEEYLARLRSAIEAAFGERGGQVCE